MIGAAQIGQAGPNMEAIAKSRGAAYCVYDIINKVPSFVYVMFTFEAH